MVQVPRVASKIVPFHVVQRVATEVTERAEVCRPFVVDAHFVLTQFGHSPKGLVANIAAVTTDPCVKRLVLFQAIAPCGAKRTIPTTVRSCTFVFEGNMLRHAPLVFAGESTVLAMQAFRFSNGKLFFVMNIEDVTG